MNELVTEKNFEYSKIERCVAAENERKLSFLNYDEKGLEGINQLVFFENLSNEQDYLNHFNIDHIRYGSNLEFKFIKSVEDNNYIGIYFSLVNVFKKDMANVEFSFSESANLSSRDIEESINHVKKQIFYEYPNTKKISFELELGGETASVDITKANFNLDPEYCGVLVFKENRKKKDISDRGYARELVAHK